MRTTVDIDDPILAELRILQKREKKSLGRLVSDLLATALAEGRQGRVAETAPPVWISKVMGARVDLEDKDALYSAMDAEAGS